MTIPAGGAAPIFATINFQLANIPNHTEFIQLYDQYQIKGVKVAFVPRINSSESGVTAVRNVWSVLDYDDSSIPTSRDQLLQYQNVKMTPMTRKHKRYFKPAIAAQMFATGILSAYGAKKNQWIDCTYDQVEHYGVKYCFDQLPAGVNPVTFDVVTTMYLAFKNVR